MGDSPSRGCWPKILLPALFVSCQLFLFGPAFIFLNNRGEVLAPIGLVFWLWLLVAAVLAVALVGVGALFVRWGQRWALAERYGSLLLAFGALAWAQGNLLVVSYGVLDGRDIEWAVLRHRGPWEMALWISVLLLALIAGRRLSRGVALASLLMLILQSAGLLASAATEATDRPEWSPSPPPALFELSKKANVFHLVLDGFQSDVFAELVMEERALYDRKLDGFVFFRDHAGASPTTRTSIPAMLSGNDYRNQRPLPRYLNRVVNRYSLSRILSDQGYDFDSAAIVDMVPSEVGVHYLIPSPYASRSAYVTFVAAQLIEYSLFRHGPHYFKRWLYDDQRWRLQRAHPANGRSHHASSGAAFLHDFTARMSVARDRPVYKYLHVGIPHLPVVLDQQCNYRGPVEATRENYLGQAECGLVSVIELLDRLRDLGLYGESLIILSSDHGIGLRPPAFRAGEVDRKGLARMVGSAAALLVIKRPGSTGALEFSDAPTAMTDIPATVLQLLGVEGEVPGKSVFALAPGEPRARRYSHYPWRQQDWTSSFLPYLDVFSIDGPLFDAISWSYQETISAPGNPPDALREHVGKLKETWSSGEPGS